MNNNNSSSVELFKKDDIKNIIKEEVVKERQLIIDGVKQTLKPLIEKFFVSETEKISNIGSNIQTTLKNDFQNTLDYIAKNLQPKGLMKRFNDSCERDINILRRTEKTIGNDLGRLLATLIMSDADTLSKENEIKITTSSTYKYSNLQDIYSMISNSVRRKNEELSRQNQKIKVGMRNEVIVNIFDDRNCVVTVVQRCEVYKENPLESLSCYTCETEMCMSHMLMKEDNKNGSYLMKDKGSWISYIKRYALGQLLQVASNDMDVEKMAEKEDRKEFFNKTTNGQKEILSDKSKSIINSL